MDTQRVSETRLLTETQTQYYTYRHSLNNGIEWISYVPHQRKHSTPILMQHGMWHGAWCWQWWQECFAEWGWECHAISLPGHGLSPMQRPIRLCTLDYYLKFVRAAIDSLPENPILMGHSMGGALTQWYLRYIGNLPAAVLVAAWALYKGYVPSVGAFLKLDIPGVLLSAFKMRAEYARTPERAASALLSRNSVLSPQELYARLGPESYLVMMQHLVPWGVSPQVTTPMLWLGAECDAVIPEHAARRAASIYPTADYMMIKESAHNIMMEPNYREIAQTVDRWLDGAMVNREVKTAEVTR